MRRRYVAYIRVANKDDFAVETQKHKIKEYAKKRNINIDYYYIDNGYSGTNLNRPQLGQLLRDAKSKKITDEIIFVDNSRLSRDIDGLMNIISRLSKRNVELISLTDNETTMNFIRKISLNFFKENQKIKREMMEKKGAYITSPFKRGTIEDNNFRREQRKKLAKEGIYDVQFKYINTKGEMKNISDKKVSKINGS